MENTIVFVFSIDFASKRTCLFFRVFDQNSGKIISATSSKTQKWRKFILMVSQKLLKRKIREFGALKNTTNFKKLISAQFKGFNLIIVLQEYSKHQDKCFPFVPYPNM